MAATPPHLLTPPASSPPARQRVGKVVQLVGVPQQLHKVLQAAQGVQLPQPVEQASLLPVAAWADGKKGGRDTGGRQG